MIWLLATTVAALTLALVAALAVIAWQAKLAHDKTVRDAALTDRLMVAYLASQTANPAVSMAHIERSAAERSASAVREAALREADLLDPDRLPIGMDGGSVF